MRIKFRKGEQRKFLDLVLEKLMSPSLRALEQYGISIKYQTLKSYYAENRTLPEELFEELCTLANINKKELSFVFLEDNWGKVKGGER